MACGGFLIDWLLAATGCFLASIKLSEINHQNSLVPISPCLFPFPSIPFPHHHKRLANPTSLYVSLHTHVNKTEKFLLFLYLYILW